MCADDYAMLLSLRHVALLPLMALSVGVINTPSAAHASTLSSSAASTTCPGVPAPSVQPPLATQRVFGPGLGPTIAHQNEMVLLQGNQVVHVTTAGEHRNVTLSPAPAYPLQYGAVDAEGAVYLLNYPYGVEKYGVDGQLLWSRTAPGSILSLFVIGSGTTERLGVVDRTTRRATLWALDGTPSSTQVAVTGDAFNSTPAGGVLALDDGRYVREFNSAGKAMTYVGDRQKDNDPMPAASPPHYYQLGGAAKLPDGGFLVTDTKRGILVLSPEGLVRGELPPNAVDTLGLTQASRIVVSGDDVLIAAGERFSNNQYLVHLSLADLLARATHGESNDPRLGLGAGLGITQADSYVPAGQTPTVTVRFDGWWQSLASTMSVCWSLQNQDQFRSGTIGSSGNIALSDLAIGSDGTTLALGTSFPPGAYWLRATLVREGVAMSTTKLTFTVAAPDDRLNLATLPPGADFGGPSPARGVALADVLGTGLQRAGVKWEALRAGGADAPLTFGGYDRPFSDAADEAAKRGVTFEVQLGERSATTLAMVNSGEWERRVEEVVTHFKSTVHVWEAWNEPNLTYGAPADYVAKVLVPFYRAVKAADPTATVVGGSTAGVSLGYWGALIKAGGLEAMDVAGVHAYTGHNRSWEEDDTVRALRYLKTALVKAGGAPLPMWNTEQAFWSNGPYNILAQADSSSREMLWSRSLGMDKWAYFVPEGGFGDNGVSYSAIEVNDAVKPAALALMTTSSQLRGRPFLEEVALGAPSTYALRFGPRSGDAGSGELLAAWTDGVDVPAMLTADLPGTMVQRTEELGSSGALTLDGPSSLTLRSAPVFLAVQGAGRLGLAPRESYNVNLALASQGATAVATSSRYGNTADKAIDGINGAGLGGGDLPGLPVWTSGAGDADPTLTVHLHQVSPLDRVVVATHSIGSTVPGLRDYDVDVRASADAEWTTVGQVRGQFSVRQHTVSFPSQTVSDIRVRVEGVNHSGYLEGGAPPTWWPIEDGAPFGPAVVSELLAFAPGTLAAGDLTTPKPDSTSPSPSPSPSSGSQNAGSSSTEADLVALREATAQALAAVNAAHLRASRTAASARTAAAIAAKASEAERRTPAKLKSVKASRMRTATQAKEAARIAHANWVVANRAYRTAQTRYEAYSRQLRLLSR